MDIAERAPVAEPFVVQDIFATGLLRIEPLSPSTCRFVLYVNQISSFGEPERVIVCRIIMDAEAARDASRKTLAATSDPNVFGERPNESCH